jgi:hypothetical protein
MLEREVGWISHDFRDRRFYDSMVTKRLREERDSIINGRRESRNVITGLINYTPMSVETEDKKKWLNETIGELLNKTIPESPMNLLFAKTKISLIAQIFCYFLSDTN